MLRVNQAMLPSHGSRLALFPPIIDPLNRTGKISRSGSGIIRISRSVELEKYRAKGGSWLNRESGVKEIKKNLPNWRFFLVPSWAQIIYYRGKENSSIWTGFYQPILTAREIVKEARMGKMSSFDSHHI